jgi:arylsulfatase A-like enzyme
LFVSFLEPHHQNEKDDYPAPEVYRDAFKDGWMPPDLAALGGTSPQHLAGYYGQVKRLDECLGRLRDALLSLELADSTMLAYTSDHGSHFKTRNGEYKRSCHDSSIRVPLLIEGPGFEPGLRITRPVTTADVAPTLLRAAQVQTPEGMRTAGLLASTDDAVLIQVSEAETGRALRTPRWKYHVVADPDTSASASDRYREAGLYDLDADPYELDNLIGSRGHRAVADELRARLIERIREVEHADSRIEVYAGELREERFMETVVRSSGLRGSRFGHQSVEVQVQ